MTSVLLSVIACSIAPSAPVHGGELIFPQNPKHNHASSIVQTPGGDLLACWFHGSGERTADDVLIQGARKRKGQDTWCTPFVMADTPGYPDCNPALFIDPRHTLWLFWITVQEHQWGKSLLKYQTSDDYAKDGPPHWAGAPVVVKCHPKHFQDLFLAALAKTEAKYGALLKQNGKLQAEIKEVKKAATDDAARQIGWMTRLHPIMTSKTRMMLGLYSDVFNCGLAAFTEDWGKTWQFSEPILSVDPGNIQPSFVKRKNGDIVAFMRDNGMLHKIRRAESKDGGVTWSPADPIGIMNPGSSLECIALRDGNWVLVCNDVPGRYTLTAYLSDDEGATWKWKRHLENFPPGQGSASYPSVIQTTDGLIHCTYSYDTKAVPGSTIKHAWFNEDWIRAGDR